MLWSKSKPSGCGVAEIHLETAQRLMEAEPGNGDEAGQTERMDNACPFCQAHHPVLIAVCPLNVAPPTVAPPAVAPPTVAPPAVAPPTDAPLAVRRVFSNFLTTTYGSLGCLAMVKSERLHFVAAFTFTDMQLIYIKVYSQKGKI